MHHASLGGTGASIEPAGGVNEGRGLGDRLRHDRRLRAVRRAGGDPRRRSSPRAARRRRSRRRCGHPDAVLSAPPACRPARAPSPRAPPRRPRERWPRDQPRTRNGLRAAAASPGSCRRAPRSRPTRARSDGGEPKRREHERARGAVGDAGDPCAAKAASAPNSSAESSGSAIIHGASRYQARTGITSGGSETQRVARAARRTRRVRRARCRARCHSADAAAPATTDPESTPASSWAGHLGFPDRSGPLPGRRGSSGGYP